MSPQSSLSLIQNQGFNVSNMSNLLLTQAANEAFSKNKRLDIEFPQIAIVTTNPLDNESEDIPEFQRRKRKVSSDDVPSSDTFPNYSDNFLSAIFDDIAKAQEENNSVESSQSNEKIYGKELDTPSALKKPRLSEVCNLTRTQKSFRNLKSALAQSSVTLSTEATQLSAISRSPSSVEPFITSEEDISEHTPSNQSIIIDHYTEAANIIDSVLNVDIIFPNIPATVSENSCSPTNDLTHMSVPATNSSEEPTNNPSEGKKNIVKDSYGWFVEMDNDETLRNRTDAIADASDKTRITPDTLSFSAVTAPKRVVDDDELEWAKAADTVDDVLGCFF